MSPPGIASEGAEEKQAWERRLHEDRTGSSVSLLDGPVPPHSAVPCGPHLLPGQPDVRRYGKPTQPCGPFSPIGLLLLLLRPDFLANDINTNDMGDGGRLLCFSCGHGRKGKRSFFKFSTCIEDSHSQKADAQKERKDGWRNEAQA